MYARMCCCSKCLLNGCWYTAYFVLFYILPVDDNSLFCRCSCFLPGVITFVRRVFAVCLCGDGCP